MSNLDYCRSFVHSEDLRLFFEKKRSVLFGVKINNFKGPHIYSRSERGNLIPPPC